MAIWETEDEMSSPAAISMPRSSDAPYRASSRSSRRSRRSLTPDTVSVSSPSPPLPSDKAERMAKLSSRDVTTDETISVLDPRRFTPTLHANLVSEILALRRDQEEKLKIIESLETSLQTTKEEQESLQSTLSSTAKESRSLKRQLALLEGGTYTALGELARERDEAVDAITETKKRLETTQKKVRSQVEDSQKFHDLWAKEKNEWEEEKRKYERKLHVADTRLKVILDEVATLQAAQASDNRIPAESEAEEAGNNGASTRTMSMTNSIRYSVLPGKANGRSLADELNFDGDEYETDPADGRQSVLSNGQGRESVLSNARHMRNQSRDSVMMSPPRTHRRNQSSESHVRSGSVARGRLFMNQTVIERLDSGICEDDETPPAPKLGYKDTGIQFSPPPSPQLAQTKPLTLESSVTVERPNNVETSSQRGEWEIEANQRRKRVHPNRPTPIEPSSTSKLMISAISQTLEAPLSPPRTPTSPAAHDANPKPVVQAATVAPITQMISSATQTSEPPAPIQQSMPCSVLPIPSISIHPPTSRSPIPREHRLPQYVKDFGCQVSLIQTVPTKSSAAQTDEIRVDRRLDKLPAHLHPSAISSPPNSPSAALVAAEAAAEQGISFTPVPGNVPPRNPRRLSSKRSFIESMPSSPRVLPRASHDETHDAYPGNNDDGPLSKDKTPMRRPQRISSLFAGFDAASSDEGDDFGDVEVMDAEFRTPLSPPRHSASSHPKKRNPTPTTSSSVRQPRSAMRQPAVPEMPNSNSLLESSDIVTRKSSLRLSRSADRFNPMIGSKASVMRKSAMIQSGIASHQGPESGNPPFPIPTRASSRKPTFNASAPTDGQRSPTRMTESWHRRGLRNGPNRSGSIRKARSAVVIPRSQRHRRYGSRSPPPMTPSEKALESPGLPPLPKNEITSPKRDGGAARYRVHRSQPSTNTAVTENTNIGTVGSSQQVFGVVESIAQTMVGEWMYKYVRRRKSFGMADTKGDENSNARHKRWVWLAPYERAILWSSKQPTSGSALLGTSGRKMTIQSVLDVKDDNPAPKGVSQIFDRSILVLTPQRALKFTASTAERHYLWLTSLSFLTHSTQAVPENIVALPPPLPVKAPTTFDIPPTKVKRNGIRDSIMLKKDKSPEMARTKASIDSDQLEEALVFKPEKFAPIPAHQRILSEEVAQPPMVPRFQERSTERVHERANQVVLHGRKRSNTGGRAAPPLSFRGFSGPLSHIATNSTAVNSFGTAGSSDIYAQGIYQSSSKGTTNWAMSTAGSHRTSEASSRPESNFFEAIGTVRMEAFISPLAFPRFDGYPDEHEELRYKARRRSKDARRRRSRSRHRDSYNSRTTRGTDDWFGGNRTPGEEYFREDPFKGF